MGIATGKEEAAGKEGGFKLTTSRPSLNEISWLCLHDSVLHHKISLTFFFFLIPRHRVTSHLRSWSCLVGFLLRAQAPEQCTWEGTLEEAQRVPSRARTFTRLFLIWILLDEFSGWVFSACLPPHISCPYQLFFLSGKWNAAQRTEADGAGGMRQRPGLPGVLARDLHPRSHGSHQGACLL